jgi:hypothetical protein
MLDDLLARVAVWFSATWLVRFISAPPRPRPAKPWPRDLRECLEKARYRKRALRFGPKPIPYHFKQGKQPVELDALARAHIEMLERSQIVSVLKEMLREFPSIERAYPDRIRFNCLPGSWGKDAYKSDKPGNVQLMFVLDGHSMIIETFAREQKKFEDGRYGYYCHQFGIILDDRPVLISHLLHPRESDKWDNQVAIIESEITEQLVADILRLCEIDRLRRKKDTVPSRIAYYRKKRAENQSGRAEVERRLEGMRRAQRASPPN